MLNIYRELKYMIKTAFMPEGVTGIKATELLRKWQKYNIKHK